MAKSPSQEEPYLLKAADLDSEDRGVLEWDAQHNSDLLTYTNENRTVEWGPRKAEYVAKYYPPIWVPTRTRATLHTGTFQWDFVIEEMACRQIGIGFMLLWNIGPDWGFFGYLGSSTSAWAYDPSTGDVVTSTKSIEGGLPKFADGHTGVVTVHLELPRHSEGVAWFSVDRVNSQPIHLPAGAVVLPAGCLLKETQKVTLANFTSA